MSADPIQTVCGSQYRAVHSHGARDVDTVRYFVLHSTEGPSALAAASWFANPRSGGSANLVVDDYACYRTLDDDMAPWGTGVPEFDQVSIHVEQAGWAVWTRAVWLAHVRTIERAAYKVAIRADRYRIPSRALLDPEQLLEDFHNERHGGITTHAAVAVAFHPPEPHHDPGLDYPLSTFLWFLNRYRAV